MRGKQRGKAPELTTVTEEQFLPPPEWTTSPDTHLLRVQLPAGLEKDDLKVLVDGAGTLTISGRRTARAGSTKLAWVNQTFDVPVDSDVDKITGKFEDGFLTVVMPRKAMGGHLDSCDEVASVRECVMPREVGHCKHVEEKTATAMAVENPGPQGTAGKDGEGPDQAGDHFEHWQLGFVDGLLEKVRRYRKTVGVGIAAFAVGFYVSQRLRSRA